MSNDTPNNDANILLQLPEDDKKKFKQSVGSMSKRLRQFIKHWNNAEDEYNLAEETEEVNLIALKTYRNAVEQNIQVMKSQRDRLNEKIEEIEGDDNEEEVIVEIDLDIASKQ